MRIEVTQEDINKGIAVECTSCPIAQALNRIFVPLGFQSYVSYSLVYLSKTNSDGKSLQTSYFALDLNPNLTIWKETTKRMKAFIDGFDSNRQVKPFTFQLKFTKEQKIFLGI